MRRIWAGDMSSHTCRRPRPRLPAQPAGSSPDNRVRPDVTVLRHAAQDDFASVTMPTSRVPSQTGITPTLSSSMAWAAITTVSMEPGCEPRGSLRRKQLSCCALLEGGSRQDAHRPSILRGTPGRRVGAGHAPLGLADRSCAGSRLVRRGRICAIGSQGSNAFSPRGSLDVPSLP